MGVYARFRRAATSCLRRWRGERDGKVPHGELFGRGFRPFPKRGSIVTNELIDSLREDDAY